MANQVTTTKDNDWIANIKTIAVYGIPVALTAGGIIYGANRYIKSTKQISASKDVLVFASPESFANQIRMAFENDYYPGTDEESVFDAFTKMPSQGFYQQVIAAYKNLFGSSFFLQLSNSLPDDLKNELSSADYMKVASILHSKPLR